MSTPPSLPQQIPQARCTCHGFGVYLGVILLPLILFFFASAVVTYVMPKKFESKAVIQVRPSASVGTSLFQHNSSQPQNFIATEFEVIRSQLTLKEVVRKLDLTTNWNIPEEQATDVLHKMVEVKNISGTDLIEIRVRHTNPELARDIAKEIYHTYKKRREGKVREMAEEALKELEKAVQEQSEVVEEKRKRRDELLKRAPAEVVDRSPISQKAIEPEQSMLDRMNEKIALERIALKTPMNLVELHEEPVISLTPCSPKVALNLSLGAASGLALGLVIALFMRVFQGPCKRCGA